MKNVVCQNFKVVTLLIIIFGRYLHVNFGLSPCENFDSFLRPCKIRGQQCTIVKKILTCNRNSEFLHGRSCFSIFPSLILELCVPCYRWLEPRLRDREWKKNAVFLMMVNCMGFRSKDQEQVSKSCSCLQKQVWEEKSWTCVTIESSFVSFQISLSFNCDALSSRNSPGTEGHILKGRPCLEKVPSKWNSAKYRFN